MTISAEIILDSISPIGCRLTTMKLRYPRFIHSEFMTHRVFSRNASSSRAVPVSKLIADIKSDMAMPVYWGLNQKGMQAGEELDSWNKHHSENQWIMSAYSAIEYAEKLLERNVHKSVVNRLLEPYSHINVIVSATDWKNFFTLRRHKDAQPEIKVLADTMWEAMEASIPQQLGVGGWHLPFISEDDKKDTSLIALEDKIKVSVARCARVSYLTHEGKPSTIEEDISLYDRLLGAVPIHASPAEHQAFPLTSSDYRGNFRGWKQWRKFLLNESGEN